MNQFKDAAPPPPPPKSSGAGVPILIIVVVTGFALLLVAGCVLVPVALLLPAIQAARDAARMAQCVNNMKQVSVALRMYEEAHGAYPPAVVTDENGKPMHSWRVLILPYLERQDLYQRYDMSEPWNGPNNSKLLAEMPSAFKCPAAGDHAPGETGIQVITGEETMFPPTGGVRRSDVKDGESNTILLIEAGKTPVKWLEPSDFDFSRLEQGETPQGEHRHLILGTADMSILRVDRNADPNVLKELATRAGSEAVDMSAIQYQMP